MIKLTTFALVLCFAVCFTRGTVSNTELIGVEKYIENVFQLFVHDLEDEGMCNLRMRNFTDTINQTMYGDVVVGDLEYFNGFVIGVNDLRIKPKSINPFLNENSMSSYINSIVVFDGLKYSYDMQAHLTNMTQNATGIFTMDALELTMTITKNLKTGVVKGAFSPSSSSFSRRMEYQPKNYYTTVIARVFNSNNVNVSGSFSDFMKGLLFDILNKIVIEKINYPDIDYDTFKPKASQLKMGLKSPKLRG